MIPRIAIQDFYVELDDLTQRQSEEWRATPVDQKELLVSPSDFAYYVAISQQNAEPAQVSTDDAGMPMVYFTGIRVKPLSHTDRHTL